MTSRRISSSWFALHGRRRCHRGSGAVIRVGPGSRIHVAALLCLAVLSLFTNQGCGMSTLQRQQVALWEAEAAQKGRPDVRYTEDLNPRSAAALGFLPFGVGGFYVNRPGLGVSGILLWPLSVTWVPPVAYRSAIDHNYRELQGKIFLLRQELESRQKPHDAVGARLEALDDLRRAGKISDVEYREARKKVLEGIGTQPPQ